MKEQASIKCMNNSLTRSVAIIGSKYTVFISAVSPAMPLERLASMPLELPIHLAASLAVLIILLVQAIKKKEVKE